MKLSTSISAAIILAAGFASQANAQIVYGSYNGSQTGITVRDSYLNQSTFIPTQYSPNAIAAGTANTVYVTSGDRIVRYGANGTVVKSFKFGDSTINYSGIVTNNNKVYATYNGSQQGVTIRHPNTLAQLSYFSTPFNPSSIAIGANNTLYLTSGDHLYKYSSSGQILYSIASPDPGVTYTGITVKDGRVYASYKGSQNGYTVRDSNLNQLGFYNLPFSPLSIDTGINNDLYFSAYQHLYRYKIAGGILKNMEFPTINYTGIASEQ